MVPLSTKLAVVTVAVAVIGGSAVLVQKRLSHTGRGDALVSDGSSKAQSDVAISGKMISAEGMPVEGAEVMLAQASVPAAAFGPPRTGVLVVRSAADGAFELPARSDATAVIVRADEGYAQRLVAELRSDHQIVLTPWGASEGTLKIGGKALADQTIELSRMGGTLDNWNRWHVMHEVRAKTDSRVISVFHG